MIKQQLAIVIAALMITSIAFAISTTSVSATHTPTVEITPTLTTTENIDFEIDVTNTGGDPITSVDVDLPFDVDGWVGTLMAGTVILGTAGTSIGDNIDLPVTITSEPTANNVINLKVDADDLPTDFTIAAAEYTTGEKLVAAINAAKGGEPVTRLDKSGVSARWVPTVENTGYIVFTSDTFGINSIVDVANTSSAAPDLGFGPSDIVTPTNGEQGTLEALKTVLPAGTKIPIELGYGLTLTENTPITLAKTEPTVELDIWTGGAAEWVTKDDIEGCIGDYSVKLTGISAVKVPYGENLDTLNVVKAEQVGDTTVLDISWNYYQTALRPYPMLYLDTDHDGAVDALLVAGFAVSTTETVNATNTWIEAWMGVGSTWQPQTYDKGDVTDDATVGDEEYTEVKTMSEWVAIDAWAEATVMYVGYGYAPTDPEYACVDDIVINDTTYSVEPPGINIDLGVVVIVPAKTLITAGEIPVGTVVTLLNDTNVTLTDETSLIKPEVVLSIGSPVKLPAGTKIQLAIPVLSSLPIELPVTLPSDTHLVLMADVTGAMLCEDTEGEIGLGVTDARLISKTACPLVADNEVTFPPTANQMKVPTDTKVVLTISAEDMPIGSEIELDADTVELWGASTMVLVDNVKSVPMSNTAEFYLPPDYKVTATLYTNTDDTQNVTLTKGTEIILPTDAKMRPGEDTKLALLIPSNWKVAGIDGNTVTWENANADGRIGPGESLTFSIRAEIVADGEYLWTITTTDAEGQMKYKTLTTTVESTLPTIKVTMEPEMVGAGSATIKVVASEKLSNLDKVYVELDDDADKRTLISMTSDAEKKVWTGTVTIPSNGLWDENKVDIVVLATLTKDMAGNALKEDNYVNIHDPDGVRRIDTISPLLLADLEMTGTTPFDNEVNQKSQLITGTAQDNLAGKASPQDNLTVRIKVNTTTYETKSFADGAFVREIDLVEGSNTIKVWVVDRVGNVGPENEQAVFLDSLKPAIGMVSVAGKAYENNVPVNDNTPTVVLTIKDPGYPETALGIEYENIEVTLENADGNIIGALLENATPWDKTTGRFENTISEKLDEGLYRIIVNATDVMGNSSSATFWFEVDVTAPKMPELTAANNPVLDDTSATDPEIRNKTALVFYGRGLEASSTANIYLIDQATGSDISTETIKASATGEFSKSLTLDEGKVIRIEVETIDVAGNVSLRVTYGYVMVDATAPAVTLDELPEATDKASIVLSGTVTKDSWEEWTDITLTVQIGTGKVEVPCVGGSYEYSLELSEGANTIVVQAVDAADNPSDVAHATVERTVTSWGIYAIVLVIVALVMAAIAIFRKKR